MANLINKLASKETRFLLNRMEDYPEEFDDFVTVQKWRDVLVRGTFSFLDFLVLSYRWRQFRIKQTKVHIYQNLVS